MMKFCIIPEDEKDFKAILDMIKELALFEKAPKKVNNTVEQMKSEKDYFQAWLAEKEDGEIVGMALFYYVYANLLSGLCFRK